MLLQLARPNANYLRFTDTTTHLLFPLTHHLHSLPLVETIVFSQREILGHNLAASFHELRGRLKPWPVSSIVDRLNLALSIDTDICDIQTLGHTLKDTTI